MRAVILIAGLTLTLAACGDNQSSNTVNADQGLSADNIVTNDVTAIDAVTGSDANMAADVNYSDEVINETNAGGATANKGETRTTRPPDEPAPADQNAATGATANNAI